jgi:4-diphosphocytidyl-2-C-methyl-D-erythritol kinase
MSVRVFAPAKINLTLSVGPPRADSMHPLQSAVMFADVGDVIEAAPAEALSLEITGEFGAGLSADASNLVLRAAHALASAAGVKAPGALLSLEKNLPIASGIGGGSADAAATLRALNALWALDWPLVRLDPIARTLGADVPVCLAATPAYMTGAGETFASLTAPTLAAVLVNPLTPLATPDVYRRFDALKLGAAFRETPPPHWPNAAAALAAIRSIGNDLAAPARALQPAIARAEQALRADPRTLHAAMSGSGATVFALTETQADAEALADAIQTQYPDWWVADTVLAGA